MRLYEGMFIVDSTIANTDWDAAVKEAQDILKNKGAEILQSEKWEERKFTYKLKGQRRGTYLLMYFNATPDSISLIKKDLKLSENILRVLIVKVDKIKEQTPKETEMHEEEPAPVACEQND